MSGTEIIRIFIGAIFMVIFLMWALIEISPVNVWIHW